MISLETIRIPQRGRIVKIEETGWLRYNGLKTGRDKFLVVGSYQCENNSYEIVVKELDEDLKPVEGGKLLEFSTDSKVYKSMNIVGKYKYAGGS